MTKPIYKKTDPVSVIHASPKPPKVIAIGGCGRGGTTVLRHIVAALGPPMREGVAWFKPNGERVPVFANNLPLIREILKRSAASLELWGWKDIFLIDYLEHVIGIFPSIHLIFAFRDPFATAARAVAEAPDAAILQSTRNVLVHDLRILDFVESHPQIPTAFVSYEKLCQYPNKAVEQIAEFLHLEPTAAAVDRIQCGKGYILGPLNAEAFSQRES